MFALQDLLDKEIKNNVKIALAEDVGEGDLTADLIPQDQIANANVICRENAVICGIQWFNNAILLLAKQLNQQNSNQNSNLQNIQKNIQIDWFCKDGDFVTANTLLCKISCPAKILLSAERTALNFLQTLSGVATKTKHFVDIVKNSTNGSSQSQIVDTRKTIPGLRIAEKYAVYCGGGQNHRIALWDAILIKENHIIAAGGIANAMQKAKIIAEQNDNRCKFIQVEVENLQELETAINCGAKMILLDNFSVEDLYKAVEIAKKNQQNLVENSEKIILEISGNVNENTLPELAKIGIDRISIGALTKDIKSIDLSMRFV